MLYTEYFTLRVFADQVTNALPSHYPSNVQNMKNALSVCRFAEVFPPNSYNVFYHNEAIHQSTVLP